jgi:bifunctional DNase/RNase
MRSQTDHVGKEVVMESEEVIIDSVRYAEACGKWVTILKNKHKAEYFPIYMNASEANIIKKELVPGWFGDLWGYERFLVGRDVSGYHLDLIIIDEPGGILRAKLLFRKNDIVMEIECPIAGAIALAYRKQVKIIIAESSFCITSNNS